VQSLATIASVESSAAWVCGPIAALLLSCRLLLPVAGPVVHTLPARDAAGETSCAWFGDVREGVLYFGISAFWQALRASGGNPEADLASPGPRWIGRFDLASETFLAPLTAGPGDSPSGVWDVLAHPNGRIYFTTYFDFAGSVDPKTGARAEFASAGLGLNELALGPGGSILATRYGYGDGRAGSVVVLSEAGEILAEHPLAEPPGRRVAAKSVAFDPVRREIWVNTDLLPSDRSGGAALHDARVLDGEGHPLLEIREPELEFFRFGPDGTGWLVEVADGRLLLRVQSPPGRTPLERFVPLDDAFDAEHDFAQDIRVEGDGRVVITRWSGRIHVVEAGGRVQDLELPRTDAGELYYTATLAGNRVCATRCGRVDVVCADLPGP